MNWLLDPGPLFQLLTILAAGHFLLRSERKRADALYGPRAPMPTVPVPAMPEAAAVPAAVDPPSVAEPAGEDSPNLWVGKVEPYLDELAAHGHISMAVSVINLGGSEVFLKGVTGRVKARFRDAQGGLQSETLPLLKMQEHHEMMDRFPPRHSGTILVFQHVSPQQAERIMSAAMRASGITLDLREVRLIFAHKANVDLKESLPLWQGVRLRGGAFIGSVEVSFS
jgi:hypothetical protein